MQCNRKKERGAQIVEFAVVLPVLLLLALTVAEGANLLRVYQIVNNGARDVHDYGSPTLCQTK